MQFIISQLYRLYLLADWLDGWTAFQLISLCKLYSIEGCEYFFVCSSMFISDFWSSHFIITYSAFYHSSCIKWIDVKHNVTILDIRIHENKLNANRTRPDQNKPKPKPKYKKVAHTKWIGIKFQKKKRKYANDTGTQLTSCVHFSFTFTSMHSYLKWSHLKSWKKKQNIDRYERPEKSHTFALI